MISSKKPDGEDGKQLVVELNLPIRLFWELETLLKDADYLVSAGEDQVVIADLQQAILAKTAPYAVHERDRVYLRDRLKGRSEPESGADAGQNANAAAKVGRGAP